MKRIRKNKGFTLVELIVVIGILGIVGGITTLVLATSLRIGNKGRISNAVSQNGNYAQSALSDIMNASDTILEVGGSPMSDTFNCSSGGGLAARSIKVRKLDGTITTLTCDTDPPLNNNTITYQNNAELPVNLIDTSQVQIDSTAPIPCLFTCMQKDIYKKPIIQVDFSLNNKQPANLFEQNAPGTFRTSVSLRNYTPRQ